MLIIISVSCFNRYVRKKEAALSKINISPSDYTVMIKDIPSKLDVLEGNTFHEKLMNFFEKKAPEIFSRPI